MKAYQAGRVAINAQAEVNLFANDVLAGVSGLDSDIEIHLVLNDASAFRGLNEALAMVVVDNWIEGLN